MTSIVEALIEETTVRVVEADITSLDVDAVVNAANAELVMGGGVAGAIKREGGEEIEREAVAQGPIGVGQAIVTAAGRLPARYVIHAATMQQPGSATDEGIIRRATRAALNRAKELNLGSIAIPALGTGVGGFPLDRAAEVMVEEVREHVRLGTSLRDVRLVVRGGPAREAFTWALRQVGPPTI